MNARNIFLNIIKIVGLLPEKRRFSYFYSVFLLVLSILNFLKWDFIVYKEYDISITGLTEISASFLMHVVHIEILLTSLLNCQKYATIRKELAEIDDILQKEFSERYCQSRIGQSFYLKLFISLFQFQFFVITIGFLFVDSTLEFWNNIGFTRVTINTRMLHIMFYMQYIQHFLHNLDNILQDLDYNQIVLERKLKMYKEVFMKLSDTLKLVNDCFGVDLLFIVSQNILAVVVNSFWIFLKYAKNHSGPSNISSM